MSCREIVELITAYFDGKLSWREKRRFEKHIRACPWCARYLEQMRVTIRAVGRLEEEALSPHAREELLGAFRNWSAAG
jgi:anti-sigma factor RsiW